jgi:NAD(P)-dependent dehydrogenase (short-subunit alcohol dehydrogenase family)
MQVKADVTRLADIEAMRRRVEGELGPIDILVANAGGNPVPPGPLEEISEEGWHAQRQALIEQHPVRRLGTPEDVAAAALFLASEESGWITGVILDVAGGAVTA